MSTFSLLKVRTSKASPVDPSSADPADTTTISAFLTTQSLANFAAMTGAIGAAWYALTRLSASFSGIWVPYAFAGLFVIVSILISLDSLKNSSAKLDLGKVVPAVFVGIINGLVLASAVVGASSIATGNAVGK